MAKCFHEAKDYIAVEEEKIANTLNWIVRHQATNGSFHEPPQGRVCHQAMQVVLSYNNTHSVVSESWVGQGTGIVIEDTFGASVFGRPYCKRKKA